MVVQVLPREAFKGVDKVEPGMQFEGPPPGSKTAGMPDDAIYTVTEVYPDHVVLDGNHPLAGQKLIFDVFPDDPADPRFELRLVSGRYRPVDEIEVVQG